MNRTRWPGAVLGALLLSQVPDAAQAQSDDRRTDLQLWNEARVVAPLHDAVDLALFAETRLSEEFELAEWRVGSELGLSLGEYVTLASGYTYIEEPSDSGTGVEHRPLGTLTLRTPRVAGFRLSTRNRVEWQIGEEESSTRYRNQVELTRELRSGGPTTLFAYGEPFYDFTEEGWTRYRLSAGLRRNLPRSLTAEFGYLFEHDRTARPAGIHVVTANLEVRL